MKKLISFFVCSLGLSFLVISCNKTHQTAQTDPISFSQKTDKAKVVTFSNDRDWQIIATKNLEVITKLVESNVNINKLDFSNEENFLNVLGMSKTEYLAKSNESKAASGRLIERYDLIENSTPALCISCKTTPEETIAKLKKVIVSFRENKASFAKFKSLLSTPPSTNLVDPGDYCCRWGFYACVGVCSFSFPAFPAYLLCCAVCYAEFCCS
jgi:hypothetical protein